MTLKIEKLVETMPVFDVTVDKTENFFANGILVHNCQEITLITVPMGTKETYEIYVPNEDVLSILNELGQSDLVDRFEIKGVERGAV